MINLNFKKIICIIGVIFTVCIWFLVNPNANTIQQNDLQKNEQRFEFSINEDIKIENLNKNKEIENKIITEISFVPSDIYKKVVNKGNLIIKLVDSTDKELTKILNKEINGYNSSFVSNENTIFINNKNYVDGTALKEFAFAFDTIISGENFGLSRSSKFEKIYFKECKNVENISSEEYFAKEFCNFFLNPEEIAKKPLTYSYFKKLLK